MGQILNSAPVRGVFAPEFYSDIEDFTQILCRYLHKKLAAKASVTNKLQQSNIVFMLFPGFLHTWPRAKKSVRRRRQIEVFAAPSPIRQTDFATAKMSAS